MSDSSWWKSNCEKLPTFTYVLSVVITNSPNSYPHESIFNIFNSTFDDDQKSSYTDYMQLSRQSQFNKRQLQQQNVQIRGGREGMGDLGVPWILTSHRNTTNSDVNKVCRVFCIPEWDNIFSVRSEGIGLHSPLNITHCLVLSITTEKYTVGSWEHSVTCYRPPYLPP